MNRIFPLLVLFYAIPAFAAEDVQPNFIFILADDCSYRDLELYGGPAKTPHINELASQGMTFNRCYQSAPMCSPTRHALYTGLYPVKSGAYPNHAQAYGHVKSIPHYLGEMGYRVALAGKTHVDPKSVFPFEYINEFADPIDEDVPLIDGWRYPEVHRLLQDSAEGETPFCLFLCSNEPHGPYTKGDPSIYRNAEMSPQQLDYHRSEYEKYLAEITYFDGQVGEVLEMLDELHLRNDTLVIVATEQGSSFPFGKWTCYEIGVASGLIASWPDKIEAGVESDAIVEYTDVVPTFLDIAGAEIPVFDADAAAKGRAVLPGRTTSPGRIGVKKLDGCSFFDVLTGGSAFHSDYAFSLQTTRGVNGYKEPYGIRSIVGQQYRYIRNLFPENEFSIPSSRRVYDRTRNMDEESRQFADSYLNRPAEELYDIIHDPYCQNNLIENEQLSGIKNELARELNEWMRDQEDSGRQVELDAYDHQADWRKSQHNNN
jgi:N-sulfoglucosamine sulfohydrolase